MPEVTLRFFDTTGKHLTINYCNFTINVNYLENNIELRFSYDYLDENDQSGNPFNQIDKRFIVHKDGIVIHRNSLTEKLIDYLLMDYTDLTNITGCITPMAYKIIILKMICELW